MTPTRSPDCEGYGNHSDLTTDPPGELAGCPERGGTVPAQASAETFTPPVGFFSSEAEAERLVDSLK